MHNKDYAHHCHHHRDLLQRPNVNSGWAVVCRATAAMVCLCLACLASKAALQTVLPDRIACINSKTKRKKKAQPANLSGTSSDGILTHP